MHATRPTVLRWLQIGKREGATHMLLVEDILANVDLPVYVAPAEKLSEKIKRFDDAHKMRLIATFDLLEDFEKQLSKVCRERLFVP